jgi:hypothetical protein
MQASSREVVYSKLYTTSAIAILSMTTVYKTYETVMKRMIQTIQSTYFCQPRESRFERDFERKQE